MHLANVRFGRFMVFAAAIGSTVFSQEPARQSAPSNPPRRTADAAAAEKIALRNFEPWELEVGARVWMRMQELKRLHQAVEQRVNLTPEQKKAVASKFEEINERLRREPIISARRPIPLPFHSPERLAELEGKLKAAKDAGNEADSARIELEIRKGTPGTNENLDTPLLIMVDEIKTLVRPDQLEALNVTMDRWHALEIRSPFDGSLRMIARAVRDPDLKLTSEQHASIQEALKSTGSKLPEPRKGRLGANTAVSEEAKAAVFQFLNEEQRKIVDKHLADFKVQLAELEAIRKHRREHHGGPNPYLEKAGPKKDAGGEEKHE